MEKAERRQARLDINRLYSVADRLDKLTDAYTLALDDLRIARQGLKTIATWARCEIDPEKIHYRAMDTLSMMYHK
jgi:hypothetical protein